MMIYFRNDAEPGNHRALTLVVVRQGNQGQEPGHAAGERI